MCVRDAEGDAAELEEVDDALEGWWTGREWMDDIEEEVDLRPLRLLLRRYED